MTDFFTDLAHDMESGTLGVDSRVDMHGNIPLRTTIVKNECITHRTGSYYAIDDVDKYDIANIVDVVRDIIVRHIEACQRVLIVGFGNDEYTCDRLGRDTLRKIDVESVNDIDVVTIAPLVESVTGMDSLEVVASIKDRCHPDIIIAVDTLATSKITRLGTCIQLTDAGMHPGGGVGKHGHIIDSDTMGVPVLAVGVPLVISVEGIFLVPSTIDSIIDSYSNIISRAIMSALLHE